MLCLSSTLKYLGCGFVELFLAQQSRNQFREIQEANNRQMNALTALKENCHDE
jgi:hypothetical protein